MTDPTPAAEAEAPAAKPTPTAPPKPPKPAGILARAKQSAAGREREGGELYLFSIRDEVAELLQGSPFEPDSYLQAAYREIVKSPQLTTAAKQSGTTVLGAVMLGATLQLPIGGPLGQFYLTPRSEGRDAEKRTVCVPMIGYRGFFELGYRSGRIQSFDYLIVREGDTFITRSNSERGNYYDWTQYEGGEFDELDEDGKVRPLTGVVAIAYPTNGGRPAFKYLSRAAIERRRPKYWQGTPWSGKDADAMYVKTPHRELAKYLQLSIATAKAVEADETISLWQRATGALETLPQDAGVIDAEESDEKGPGAGDVQSSEPNAEPVAVPVSENPEPAQRRTAARPEKVHPRDLPDLVKAEKREMTPDEFDDYSAWQADEAAGR